MLDAIDKAVPDDAHHWPYDNNKLQQLDSDIYNALMAKSTAINGSASNKNAIIHPRYDIGGLQYTAYHTHKRDSTIFFWKVGEEALVPARIRQIFSIPGRFPNGTTKENIFLAVHRHKRVGEGVNDPFKEFGKFGASLWSTALEEVEIIERSEVICHGIVRTWAEETVVLRPLNKVSGWLYTKISR